MFEIVIDGILVGLILVLFVGPAFFYLIKVSLEKGFLEAALFALGIIVSDLTLITLIYLGFSTVLENELFQKIFSLIASTVLLILGIMTFKSAAVKRNVEVNLNPDHHLVWYFFKGIIINGFNPFTFLIWLGVVGGIGLRESYGPQEFRYFFTGLLITIFLADILKAYLANQIRKILNEKLIRKVNRILAVIFFVLGLRMLIYFISLVFDLGLF